MYFPSKALKVMLWRRGRSSRAGLVWTILSGNQPNLLSITINSKCSAGWRWLLWYCNNVILRWWWWWHPGSCFVFAQTSLSRHSHCFVFKWHFSDIMMIGNDLQPNDGLLPPQREYQIHILTTVLSIAMTSRVCTDFSKPHPQLKEVYAGSLWQKFIIIDTMWILNYHC